MSEASGEPAADTPASTPRRVWDAIDGAVYEVEIAFVTAAALVMTATVSLDIVYRSFRSEDSKIAEKLAAVIGWFSANKITKDTALYGTLRDVVAPMVLIALTFAIGWGVWAAVRRRMGKPRPALLGIAVGVIAVIAAYAFVQLLLEASSRHVCVVVAVVGAGVFFFSALRRRHTRGMVAAAVVGAITAWASLKLPQGYIWSRELSLILLAWVAFVGGSMATRQRRHILVDALGRLIPARLSPWARALSLAITTAFCLYLTALAYTQIFGPRGDLVMKEVRPSTKLPGWTITASMLVGFGFMTIRFAAYTLDALIHPRPPEHKLMH